MRISDWSSDVCSSDLHALGTLQYHRDLGVRLPLLHFLERRNVRVAIVEPGHEAQCDLPVRLMIEETAAVGVRVERPALRVDHAARGVVFGIDVPQFIDAETIDLRLAITVERELRLEHLGPMAAQNRKSAV